MGYFSRFGKGTPRLSSMPGNNLGIIVVIPAYNEPDIISSIESLYNCDTPEKAVEIIVVVNCAEESEEEIKKQNEKTINDLSGWKKINNKANFNVHIINEQELPKKHAGVGLARKIGMDEAAYRFNQINFDGIILCFDADSTCDKNYLTEIEKQFINNKANAASIYFEHPITGNEFPTDIYKAIIDYELFLRYYVEALRYAGYPYAYHTIGSSMAVRSSVYQKQGGMNKRKAGEDFYFLHKIIPLGNFIEINDTKVIPSPRISNRVPFGTGKAVSKWLEELPENYRSYSLSTFKDLKTLFEQIPSLYKNSKRYELLPDSLKMFMPTDLFEKKLAEIKTNSNEYASFRKRFYTWWDGFLVLKFVHFARDNFYPDTDLNSQVINLLKIPDSTSNLDLLILLREKQKK